MIKEDIQRQINAIKALSDDDLWEAYYYGYRNPNLDSHDSVVKAVIESRFLTRIADETKLLDASIKALGVINTLSATEVHRLADSSDKLERLTRTLRNLTWVLILLTVITAIIPIGIEIWKASSSGVPLIQFSPPPPRSAPQRPALPPG
jgi:hypothetical protein